VSAWDWRPLSSPLPFFSQIQLWSASRPARKNVRYWAMSRKFAAWISGAMTWHALLPVRLDVARLLTGNGGRISDPERLSTHPVVIVSSHGDRVSCFAFSSSWRVVMECTNARCVPFTRGRNRVGRRTNCREQTQRSTEPTGERLLKRLPICG
jgi:hypothetical protein